MNQEWRDWTQLNLSRGCNPVELVEILRRNGFGTKAIKAVMKDRYPASYRAPDEIDYPGLSQCALARNPGAVGAEALDDERLQLYLLKNFLSPEECEGIMALMDSKLRPSTVTTGNLHYGYRTSSTCDLGQMTAPLIKTIDLKIARTLGLNVAWSEEIQGQKYLVGQEFKAHTDYFQPQSAEYEKFAGARGQRSWTFMIYLNTTDAGGATRFTKIGRDFLPEQGTAVVWNNLLDDGTPNAMTEHHGMPVEKGYKSIITKWFRDRGEGALAFS